MAINLFCNTRIFFWNNSLKTVISKLWVPEGWQTTCKEPTNIRYHTIKFSSPDDQRPRICVSLVL